MLLGIPIFVLIFCRLFKSELSKPQFEHFSKCLTQRLVYTPKKHTISFVQKIFLKLSSLPSVNRFFTQTFSKWMSIREKRLSIIEKYFKHSKDSLIIDDLLCEKTGKKMDDVAEHHCHLKNKKVLGHCLVTSYLQTKKGKVGYDYREYFLKETKPNNFKTKLELGFEMVKDAFDRNLIKRVLFDSWYAVKPFLKSVSSLGLQIVAMHRVDKTKIRVDGKKIMIKKFVESLSDEDFTVKTIKMRKSKKKIRYHCRTVYYYSIGKLKMVISQTYNKKKKTYREPRIYFTNVLYLSALKILQVYLGRWDIEVFHREAKQSLGLGDYQVQRVEGRNAHFELTFVAELFLQLKRFSLFSGKRRSDFTTVSRSNIPLEKVGTEDLIWNALAAKEKGTLKEFLEVIGIRDKRFSYFI